ncbi:carbohydrate kinase [Proteiniclasticum sp. SCR006]|uniref:Carbohydrate kinase n=1 Tax=Proteiniclasticum aestuarii TaxID=2817862 RepID=A0A939KGE5_9CLOT|nr:FGGY-family carbohydrate kinase [Proteiniclasticum aestuarii]MBO1265437.1 carbohydrate kinase [Proteiniclasticum aestuarii]
MGYLIGIDAGTSRVKAVLFDLDGYEVKSAYRDNEPVLVANGGVEQDMNVLWEKVLDCLVEVTANLEAEDVLGISITGQGEGIWLIDEDGEPVSNAYLWNDGRSKDVVDDLIQSKNDLYDKAYKFTGTQPFPGTALSHLMWAKKHRPEVLEKAKNLLFCKDWIRFKLTGEVAMEYSDSATSLMDINNLEFSRKFFAELGIEEVADLMSEVKKSYEIAGTVTKEIAHKLGISENTPVGVGAIDVIASSVGVGAINSGDTSTILGTTCATVIVTDTINPGHGTSRFEVHGRDGLYVNLQPTMSGTPNIDWVLNNISNIKSYKEIDAELAKMPPVPKGVIYHPYISTSGERSPFYCPNARANFFGLNNYVSRMEMVKAVYEGIAFSIKDCLEGSLTTEEGTIYLAGGGADSPVWAQIISDVTGRNVEVSEGNEFAAKGVAMMLGVTLGIYDSFEDAKNRTCRSKASYKPIAENTEQYAKYFELYHEARVNFENLWNKRSSILNQIGKEVY